MSSHNNSWTVWMWSSKTLSSLTPKSSFSSLSTSGLLHTVCPARVLARAFLRHTVTKDDQQLAANETYFHPNKVFLGASRFNIFFLTAQHSATSMNCVGRTRTASYFPVTPTTLLGCMGCIQSLLGPPLMTIIPSYSVLETSKDMFVFISSLPSFSAILTQLSTISCYILWCRSNSMQNWLLSLCSAGTRNTGDQLFDIPSICHFSRPLGFPMWCRAPPSSSSLDHAGSGNPRSLNLPSFQNTTVKAYKYRSHQTACWVGVYSIIHIHGSWKLSWGQVYLLMILSSSATISNKLAFSIL